MELCQMVKSHHKEKDDDVLDSRNVSVIPGYSETRLRKTRLRKFPPKKSGQKSTKILPFH
jgi:hypothetical protein